MIAIGDIFSAAYGDKRFETKSQLIRRANGTPLIASGARNNGIFGRFAIPATRSNIVTVARTGSVGAAFFHGYPCEVSSDAIVLSPRQSMPAEEMLWFAYVISLSRFCFNFGRKATPNRIESMRVPSPAELRWWKTARSLRKVRDTAADEFSSVITSSDANARGAALGGESTVGELFDIQYGNSYELCNMIQDPRGFNFVSRTSRNNGVSAKVLKTDEEPFPAGCITVALSGQRGALETFLQSAPFYTGFHVAVLRPKVPMTMEQKLFCCVAIRLHKFRFGFGRQANRGLPFLRISAAPNWLKRSTLKEAQKQLASEIRKVPID